MSVEICTSLRQIPHRRTISARATTMLALATTGSIAIAVVGDKKMRALNRRFRNVDATTDVLSFASGATGGHLGDVVISLPRARRQARERKHSLLTELTHLACHGILHLIGHDHERADDRLRMQREETRLLAAVGVSALAWPD